MKYNLSSFVWITSWANRILIEISPHFNKHKRIPTTIFSSLTSHSDTDFSQNRKLFRVPPKKALKRLENIFLCICISMSSSWFGVVLCVGARRCTWNFPFQQKPNARNKCSERIIDLLLLGFAIQLSDGKLPHTKSKFNSRNSAEVGKLNLRRNSSIIQFSRAKLFCLHFAKV